ncbi:hypothetical protein QTP88_022830 [Uroleucon formosanum]
MPLKKKKLFSSLYDNIRYSIPIDNQYLFIYFIDLSISTISNNCSTHGMSQMHVDLRLAKYSVNKPPLLHLSP